MSERSGGRERSEQSGASERVSGASERANGRGRGPVLQSVFLAVFDHSGEGRNASRRGGGREIDRGREIGRTCSAVCALIGSLKLDDAWVMGVVQSALLFSTSCSTPRIQRVLSSHPFVPAGSPFVH